MLGETNGIIRIGPYQFNKNEVLGKGATGYVYKGTHLETNETVAVKAIDMTQVTNEVTQYLLDGQKKAMTTIKNPYVIKTHEIIQQPDYCYIVMEQCTQGTLKDLIARKGRLQDDQALQIFRKLVIGYAAIIEGLFIHRDLKTANILIRADGDPVIIDFGYCEMIMGKRPMIQYNVGSPSYMSPEAYNKSRYSEKSDIWSLGVILHQMLTGKTLDDGINMKQFLTKIENQGYIQLNTFGMKPVFAQLLQMSLRVNPQERATIHKLKYIIDKSMISIMQAKLNKKHSNSSTQSDPRIMEPRMISQGHILHNKPKQPKQLSMVASNHNLKSSINYNGIEAIQNNTQVPNRNQNSTVVYTNSIPSTSMPHSHQHHHPHHPASFRRTLEKNMPPPSFKRIVSYQQVNEHRPPNIPRRPPPGMQKTVSTPSHPHSVVSLRII